MASGGIGDGDWSNTLNWWLDDQFTVPAGTTPVATDAVEVRDNVLLDSYGLALSPGVAEATFRNYIGFDVNRIGLSILSTDHNIQFYDGCYNFGTIIADGGFTSAFHDNSFNEGTVNGNCTFNDNSYNANNAGRGGSIGSITGDAVFYNNSSNQGAIGGDATFWNSSGFSIFWPGGININGDATFNDNSYVSGDGNPNQQPGPPFGGIAGVMTTNGVFSNSRYQGLVTYGSWVNNYTFPTGGKKAISISQLLNLPSPINI
jgi:hypothetical protein